MLTATSNGLANPTPTPLMIATGQNPTPTPILITSGPPPPTPTSTPTALYTHGREPTASEWTRIKGWFPRLNRWEVRITDDDEEYRLKYNCHNWSLNKDRLDIIDQWDIGDKEPPLTIGEFLSFMSSKGYSVCSIDDEDVEIVAYKKWNETHGEWDITHTEVKFSSNNNLMESKLGKYERITHPPGGLEKLGEVNQYGEPSLGFKKNTP